MKNTIQAFLLAALLLSGSTARAEDSATLTSVGSDSMDSVMTLWVNAFKKRNPGTDIKLASSGSASAPAALIEGSADLGPMARPMKEPELKEFREKYGFEPTQIRAAIAAVGVYVPASSPLKSITLEQLDAIFSADRLRGSQSSVTTWSQLGVTGELASKPVMPVGRVNGSYPNLYFKQQALVQGNYAGNVEYTADLRSLFDVVAANPNSIGFGELSDGDAKVRVIPVAPAAGAPAIAATNENLIREAYPLSRFLNVYIVRFPDKPIEPTLKQFLTYVLGEEGQKLVTLDGLLPIPAKLAAAELSKLN
jgi:phosphate transport system substrate-binding protein